MPAFLLLFFGLLRGMMTEEEVEVIGEDPRSAAKVVDERLVSPNLGCKSITKVKNWPAKSVVRTPNSKQSYQRVECPSGSLGTASSAADRIVA